MNHALGDGGAEAGSPNTINIPPRTRSRAAVAPIVLVESSPLKKTGMTPRTTSKLPMLKLRALKRYSFADDMVQNLLAGMSCEHSLSFRQEGCLSLPFYAKHNWRTFPLSWV
jgi:hypothetical protein